MRQTSGWALLSLAEVWVKSQIHFQKRSLGKLLKLLLSRVGDHSLLRRRRIDSNDFLNLCRASSS
jgi:hypothetical protein